MLVIKKGVWIWITRQYQRSLGVVTWIRVSTVQGQEIICMFVKYQWSGLGMLHSQGSVAVVDGWKDYES